MFSLLNHFTTVINLNLRVMWYNVLVQDNDMNIIEETRLFIEDGSYNDPSFGIDVLGHSVVEWWD